MYQETCRVSQDERRNDRPVTILTELREQDQLFDLNCAADKEQDQSSDLNCAVEKEQDQSSDLNCAVEKVLKTRIDLTFISENLDLYTGDHCENLADAVLKGRSLAASCMIQKAILSMVAWEKFRIQEELEQNPQLIDEVLNNG
nr:hypothetical protein [uncultured Mediterranean phage uvMED]